MEKKHSNWRQVVCPFSGEKLMDNMDSDKMAKSLQVSGIM